jgi:hypothetical protein
MPFLRAGEAASEFPEVASVDQLARGGVTAWWHGPVIAGCAAAPDPPPRVLAPEPLKFGILASPLRPAFTACSCRQRAAGREAARGGGGGPGPGWSELPGSYFPHRAICRVGAQGPGVPAASRGGRPAGSSRLPPGRLAAGG